jgi:hypothetical protein
MGKRDDLAVEMLSQKQADRLMKDLKKSGGDAFQGFMISFEDERKKLTGADETKGRSDAVVWALTPEERTYYIVKYGKQPYLLIGVSHNDTISSLAKISSSLAGKGAECLKALLEEELVHKCYTGVIYIEFSEDCDPRIHSLLLDLKNNLPEGIEKIYVFDHAASIICESKSDMIWNEKTA